MCLLNKNDGILDIDQLRSYNDSYQLVICIGGNVAQLHPNVNDLLIWRKYLEYDPNYTQLEEI